MLSEAAKARATHRGPGAWGFLFAHHWSGQLDRCYLAWLGKRPVWFCARCSGLYPSLLVVLTAQLLWMIPPGWWDFPWLYLLVLPAVVDWAAQRLGRHAASNCVRTFTGAFLGISLGRTVFLNMIQPANSLVVIQLAGFAIVVALVELSVRYKLYQSRAG